jgi:hypothetical protein
MKFKNHKTLLVISFLFIVACDSTNGPEDEVVENKFVVDSFEHYLSIKDTTDSTHTWQFDFNFIYHLENSGGTLLSHDTYIISLSSGYGSKGRGWGWNPYRIGSFYFLNPNETDTVTLFDSLITISGSPAPVEFSFYLNGVYHNDTTFANFDSSSLDGFFYTFRDTVYP